MNKPGLADWDKKPVSLDINTICTPCKQLFTFSLNMIYLKYYSIPKTEMVDLPISIIILLVSVISNPDVPDYQKQALIDTVKTVNMGHVDTTRTDRFYESSTQKTINSPHGVIPTPITPRPFGVCPVAGCPVSA